jgi:hypothetical protein
MGVERRGQVICGSSVNQPGQAPGGVLIGGLKAAGEPSKVDRGAGACRRLGQPGVSGRSLGAAGIQRVNAYVARMLGEKVKRRRI